MLVDVRTGARADGSLRRRHPPPARSCRSQTPRAARLRQHYPRAAVNRAGPSAASPLWATQAPGAAEAPVCEGVQPARAAPPHRRFGRAGAQARLASSARRRRRTVPTRPRPSTITAQVPGSGTMVAVARRMMVATDVLSI